MADITIPFIDPNTGTRFLKTFRYMGDGTYAEVISLATNPTIDIGDVTLLAGAAVIGKVDHTTTGIGHGSKTVAVAGTDVALAASTPAKWVIIQAHKSNTGEIAIGASGVNAEDSPPGSGVLLAAGESVTLAVDNLAVVFIDSTVNGEGVRYTYGT